MGFDKWSLKVVFAVAIGLGLIAAICTHIFAVPRLKKHILTTTAAKLESLEVNGKTVDSTTQSTDAIESVALIPEQQQNNGNAKLLGEYAQMSSPTPTTKNGAALTNGTTLTASTTNETNGQSKS